MTDITEHPTREGKVYCAVVLDAFSRRVVGWSIDAAPTATLVTNALGIAIGQRAPVDGTVIHSDQGTQFTSWAFTRRAVDSRLVPSMGSIGDCFDNAVIEAFCEIFHNRQRRHSALGMLTPVEFENSTQHRDSSMNPVTRVRGYQGTPEPPGRPGRSVSRKEAIMTGNRRIVLVAAALVGMIAPISHPAYAHCDGMDGPVVKAAREALAKNDVDLVLIWVGKNDESEIRRAFDRTVAVRTLSQQAKELAETYFFETLVRVHRTGEGAPFIGLKPAGRDLGPAIPAADQALKTGNLDLLANLLIERLRVGLRDRFARATAAGNFSAHDVAAGREYVAMYVTFIHYVEGLYEAATHRVEGHYPERAEDAHREK